MTDSLLPRAANTILYCRRWRETVDFYRQVLGLEIRFENDWFVEFHLTDGAHLSIADETRASIASVAGQGVTLALRVDDVDAAWHWLRARGAGPGPVHHHGWGARVCYFHDPEGHRLELWSPDPPA